MGQYDWYAVYCEPMRTQYERGRDSEYAARDRLLNDGYHTVLRMAGSHGMVDLVAVGEHNVKFVQVKRCEERREYHAELKALQAWPVPPDCQKELWIYVAGERRWVIVPA